MVSTIQPQDFKGSESRLSLNPTDSSLGYSRVQRQRSPEEQQAMAQVMQAILQDPVLMERLCDRVYDLLEADLRQQQERAKGSGR